MKSNMRKRHAGVGRGCFARRQRSQCYLGCPTEPGGSVLHAKEQTGGSVQQGRGGFWLSEDTERWIKFQKLYPLHVVLNDSSDPGDLGAWGHLAREQQSPEDRL